MKSLFLLAAAWITIATTTQAQQLTIATVTRPPFSMIENGQQTGFALELWSALAEETNNSFSIRRVDEFAEMLRLVQDGEVDAAVANISITADREAVMDFSQPIFEGGLQIMVPGGHNNNLSLLAAVFSRDLLYAIALAFALLFGGGLMMWQLERKHQPYFDRPAKEAMFPAFWWALNLVVNGGFEERVPQTFFGRIFGVFLVISSLFIVSIFVAKITAALTVDAIQNSINSVNDLYGKNVATISGSTASRYMNDRDLRHDGYENLEEMLAAFERGEIDAIVFDAPILSFYASRSSGKAEMIGTIFLRENYGIALPSSSDLAEPINQSLLKLRENGTYSRIYRKWFGTSAGN